MKVVAEEPWNWFLFEEDERWYLDVLVEHGAISFSVTAELSTEVVSAFQCDGASALSAVAGEMRYKGLMREWHAPPLPPGWSSRSVAAVHEWQRQRGAIDNAPSQGPARRPICQRVLRRHGACAASDAEAQALADVLQSAPGADQVKVVGWHPRGGYRVTLMLVWSELDAFIAHLEAHNWMSVI